MKAKKWVTFITAGISVISLICAIIANCVCIDLMYDISMAVFGSALLGFIMSLIEYFAERRKAMEDFLRHLKAKAYQKRKVAIIENGSWQPTAAKTMGEILQTMKNIEIVQTNNSKMYAGLFGNLTETANISNVTFEG